MVGMFEEEWAVGSGITTHYPLSTIHYPLPTSYENLETHPRIRRRALQRLAGAVERTHGRRRIAQGRRGFLQSPGRDRRRWAHRRRRSRAGAGSPSETLAARRQAEKHSPPA